MLNDVLHRNMNFLRIQSTLIFLTFLAVLVFIGIQSGSCSLNTTAQQGDCTQLQGTQYLAFQLFASGSTDPAGDYKALRPFISQATMESFFATVRTKIGSSNLPCRKVAIMIGPIALDHSKAEISKLITDAFDIAEKYDIAVGFHVDDGMFWADRKDLWQNPENIEWIDWNKTPNTSRYVDWVTSKLAPEMCFNAPGVQVAMKDMMTDIASAIKSRFDNLRGSNKQYLYAGTIVGWETSLDPDRDTQMSSGYHALSNKGYSANNLPADMDKERAAIVREHIEHLAAPLLDAGLPVEKTYAHIGFLSKKKYDYYASINPNFAKKSYLEVNNFSPPEVAIGKNYTPGFSTYPQNGLFDQIYDVVSATAWASCEGTNADLSQGTQPVSPSYGMESYLAKHFNHGCTLLNIFAFQLRGDPFTNALNDVSEGAEAIAAYKKFIRGAQLIEK